MRFGAADAITAFDSPLHLGFAHRSRAWTRPEMLLLDEPTSALDPISTELVEGLLRQLTPALALIIVTHNLGQARRASDNTMFLYEGPAGRARANGRGV